MTATIELSSCRRKLQQALGDLQDEYFSQLKRWFRKNISKEEFDAIARKLLSPEKAHRHNEFLLAILNKCQTLANMTPTPTSPMVSRQNSEVNNVLASPRVKRGKVKRKSKSSQTSFDQRFQPAGPEGRELGDLYEEEKQLKYCYREETLPDVAMMHGRMLVTSWEEGLEGVEDPAVEIMVEAVKMLLRNLISNLVMKRRGFKTRDGQFPYALGAKRPNPYLLNTQNRLHMSDEIVSEVSDVLESVSDKTDVDPLVPIPRPTCREADQTTMLELACGVQDDNVRYPISLFDLLNLLQEKKSVIPCHTVYALNLERVIARLYHPGHDD